MNPRHWLSLSLLGALLAVAPLAAEPLATDDPLRDDPRTRYFFNDYNLDLAYHPIGYTLPKRKFAFDNYIPMHPSGFRADDYSMFFAPTYGLGGGWEVSLGATGAQRLGPGGNAVFFGGGLQKQLLQESDDQPGVAIGAYGLAGPHDHSSQTVFLAASKRLLGGSGRGFAVFLHGGAKYERFNGDDYGDGDGLRPFVGAVVGIRKRLYFKFEVSPPQPWEVTDMYSISASYKVWKFINLNGGVRNNGYRTEPFIGFGFL